LASGLPFAEAGVRIFLAPVSRLICIDRVIGIVTIQEKGHFNAIPPIRESMDFNQPKLRLNILPKK
jgi:hypothetical protein